MAGLQKNACHDFVFSGDYLEDIRKRIQKPKGAHTMKIGICTSIGKLPEAKAIGFDYAELNLSALAGLSPAEFDEALAAIEAAGLPIEAANVLFPGGFALVGPGRDMCAVRGYLDTAMARAARVGVKVVVFGSGGARRAPEGIAASETADDLQEAARAIAEAAAKHGITAVVEPLNTGETNTINSVTEGRALMKAVCHHALGLLADYYHMAVEEEPMSAILDAGCLMHAHIARGKGRTFPLCKEDDDYEGFFRALAAIQYQGRVSIEGGTDNFAADAPAALAFLRALADECGL